MDDVSAPTGHEPALLALMRPDGAPPRALVLGATGYIGGRLVPRLLNAGYAVRVLARDPARAAAFPWGDRVEIVGGDAADEGAVGEAMRDVDVVFYLVHSMSGGKRFADTDRRAAETVAQAAAAASVGRIVYLGGLHPTGVTLSPHLQSRVEVGRTFLESGVPTIVLQAGVVIGSGSASFEMVRHLTEVLPYMPAPRWVRNRIQPIAVRDVLHYLLGAARLPADVNRAVDIGGPDVLRYGQMMNGYAVEAGLRQRAIAALPVLTPRLASHWVNLVTPIPRSIARPLVESLQNECIMKDHAIDVLIPPPEGGLTPYRTAVQLALGKLETDAIETSWQDAGRARRPERPAAERPRLGGARGVQRHPHRAQPGIPRRALARHRGDRRRERLVLLAGALGRSAAGWTASSAASGLRAGVAAVTGSPWAMRSTSGGSRRWNRDGCCASGPR